MNNLPKYIETLNIIERDIVGIKIETSKVSVKAAATLFAVTLDHAQGIKNCLIGEAYPPAFALLRVLFETYIRAMWLEKCADEKQLDKFINEDEVVSKKNKNLYFKDMILEVESLHEFPAYFSEIAKYTWDGLNSITHSGSIQLHNNFNGRTIQSCYDDEHINEALEFSAMISCMAYAGLCDLATSSNAGLESEKLMTFVQSWACNK
ncbi:DUF6988 family protein [Shewanella kaireitica]|uniref:DUF6988 family protein n=1 Tax=Shewanella kaireitica TaxID=212021 RepID=UPI00200DF900|nr:DUF5677 domain-containing protein [Shewanella kaireitica]MCL1093553.1 DUF5677 domain-containing protein [Shewanella kaireitica]